MNCIFVIFIFSLFLIPDKTPTSFIPVKYVLSLEKEER